MAKDTIAAAYARAVELGPTPEMFHSECTWHLQRTARGYLYGLVPARAARRQRAGRLLLRWGWRPYARRAALEHRSTPAPAFRFGPLPWPVLCGEHEVS